jgi:ureidoacrylate peracid hydrolase
MPDSVLLPANIEKITRRDGAPHSVTTFNPATTALLVIDMQNFYMVEGQISYCPSAHPIVPNINRLVQLVRKAGGNIIWVRNVTNDDAFRTWSNHYERMKPTIIDARKRELAEDSEGFKLWHDLDARDDDIWINKTRYSAFIEGASNMAEELEARDIDTLVFCGVVTNICVESTARDAMMLNYRTLIIEDACASNSLEAHTATLNTFYSNFGDVQMTEEFIGRFGSVDETTV